jgi:four helix bundle protein
MVNRRVMENSKKNIESHRDLLVWQRSMDLVVSIYRITQKLPSHEQFGLISQLRRAAVSIPSNIAEGYGRQSTGNYRQFLSVSRGSLLELETQIELCVRLEYLTKAETVTVMSDITEISKMLTSLIAKLK